MVIFCVKDVSELSQIIETLKKNYYKIKLKTKEFAIEWLSLLFENYSEKVLNKNDKIVGAIIQNINFKEIILTENILKLLCQMAWKYHKFLNEIVATLLSKFKQEKGTNVSVCFYYLLFQN